MQNTSTAFISEPNYPSNRLLFVIVTRLWLRPQCCVGGLKVDTTTSAEKDDDDDDGDAESNRQNHYYCCCCCYLENGCDWIFLQNHLTDEFPAGDAVLTSASVPSAFPPPLVCATLLTSKQTCWERRNATVSYQPTGRQFFSGSLRLPGNDRLIITRLLLLIYCWRHISALCIFSFVGFLHAPQRCLPSKWPSECGLSIKGKLQILLLCVRE